MADSPQPIRLQTARPEPYGLLTRHYIRPPQGVVDWKDSRVRFALQVPHRSYSGGRHIERFVDDAPPLPEWARDFAGKRVLVMGTGPSLDRAPPELLASFDTVLHVNFALGRAGGGPGEYFFTTDLSPVREYMDCHGIDDFARLGPARCLYAPVFLDHWHYLTEAGRALFTMLRPDRTHWHGESVAFGRLRLPLLWRWHPVQPTWQSFTVPTPSRSLPVLYHSSALSAVLFAAQHGASEIGMIGCDFSAGRAAVGSGQTAPTATHFAGAAVELRSLSAALARAGVTVTNHSWEV